MKIYIIIVIIIVYFLFSLVIGVLSLVLLSNQR